MKEIFTKREIREKVWREMESMGVAIFPGARGRIPNFKGAEEAAKRVKELDIWKQAKVIMANPDSPQQPLRMFALEDGKIVYMAVPRLRGNKPFVEIDPARIKGMFYEASTIKGAFRLGRLVTIDEMKKIDVIICGSVAVNKKGERIGKGGGYTDREYSMLLERGIISKNTPVITTVHPLQIFDCDFEKNELDVLVDIIVCSDKIIFSKKGI